MEFRNGVMIRIIVKERFHSKRLHAFPSDNYAGCWIWFGIFRRMIGIYIPRWNVAEVTKKDQCSLCQPIDGSDPRDCVIPRNWGRRPLISDGEAACAYFNPKAKTQ